MSVKRYSVSASRAAASRSTSSSAITTGMPPGVPGASAGDWTSGASSRAAGPSGASERAMDASTSMLRMSNPSASAGKLITVPDDMSDSVTE